MSLLNPWALLWLLLVPLAVLLHALNVRFRDRSVSTLMFWRQALADRRTSLRLRRILSNLLLLLQVLALAAMAVALAGPLRAGPDPGARGDLVLLLDVSASMKAREGAVSRFEQARAAALEEVAALRPGDRAVLVLAGARPEPAGPFSADRVETERLLRAAVPTEEPGDPAAALRLALSLCGPGGGSRIVFVTDGAFPEPAGAAEAAALLRVRRVGASARNLGLTAFRIRANPSGGTGQRLFVSAASCSGEDADCLLRVTVDGAEAYAARLRIPAGGEARVSVPWTGPSAGRAVAQLEAGDDFPVDDRAYAVLARARTLRVLLASSGNPFLESLLAAFPNCAVTRAGEEAAGGAGGDGAFDLEVFDGVEPPPLGAGAYLLLGVAPADLPVRATGVVARPGGLSWDRTNPLLASVDLDGLWIAEALRLEAGPGMETALSSAEGPLLLSYDQGGLRAVLLGFDLRRSDLPLRPALPLFFANLLTWLSPEWLSLTAAEARTGEAAVVPAPGGAPGAAAVLRPDGRKDAVSVPGTALTYRETDLAGFYGIEAAGGGGSFAVNLLSREESDIRPRWEPAVRPADPGAGDGDEAAGGRPPGTPVWPWLALAAALIALGEWVVWLRERP